MGEYRKSSSQAAKNSSDLAQAKNIFISSDGIQTGNKRQFMSLSSDPSTWGDSVSKEMTIKPSYKTVTHGIRKQQHSSSQDKETQLAGLTHKIIKQASAFYIWWL